jgi:hypothetical protein
VIDAVGIASWALARGLKVSTVVEWWEERSAIREYEGGLSREQAEMLAFEEDVYERFAPEELPPW